MENASKALLIAGGVLIAILVMTLIIYMARTMADDTSRIYKQLEEARRTEFNQKFMNYNNKASLDIQDVVTIINLAKDSNKENGLTDYTPVDINNDTSLYVTVKIDASNGTFERTIDNAERERDDEINGYLKTEMTGTSSAYKCKATVNTKTGYVNYILIE